MTSSVKPEVQMYHNAVRVGPSHSHRQHAQNIWQSLAAQFMIYANRQTDRQTDILITMSQRQQGKNLEKFGCVTFELCKLKDKKTYKQTYWRSATNYTDNFSLTKIKKL